MTPTEHLDRWTKDIRGLGGRLDVVIADDEVAWAVRALALENEELRAAPGLFLDVFWFGYLHRTVINLRAMVDGNRGSTSYRELLRRVLGNFHVVQTEIDEIRRPSRADVERWRDEFVGAVEVIKKYGDKVVAHWDHKQPPPLDDLELRRGVWEAVRIHRRLLFMLTGTHLHLPTVDSKWLSALRVPIWPEAVDPGLLWSAMTKSTLEQVAVEEGWQADYWI